MPLAYLALLLGLLGTCLAVPNVTLLGAFNHQADESSPMVWHGKLVIMETLPNYNPQHQSFCPTDYFTVRDLASWEIIATVQISCNHAFGSALVTTDSAGVETMWIYGTRWIRDNVNGGVGWDGPCSKGACGLDVFWSTDLKTWKNASAVDFPKGTTIYNTDVTYVSHPPSSLPPHNWVLVIEQDCPKAGYCNYFYIKNAPTLDQGEWVALNTTKYTIPNFSTGGNQIGACPSIRFVQETGYYYVTTGGSSIWIVRSKDLATWEQGHYNGGRLIQPTPADCNFMSSTWTAWKPPNATVELMKTCSKWDVDVSDSDMTEFTAKDGSVDTIVLYQPNNQAGTGFSNLFLHHGDYKSFFESYFD